MGHIRNSVCISQFFNFSSVCLNFIYPLSSHPIYIHCRSNVLPQIEVAKVIFFLIPCRRCRMACRQKWFKASFPFSPSTVSEHTITCLYPIKRKTSFIFVDLHNWRKCWFASKIIIQYYFFIFQWFLKTWIYLQYYLSILYMYHHIINYYKKLTFQY